MSADADAAESDAFERACEELLRRILEGDLERDDLESAKLDACSEFSAPKVPKNADILDRAPAERREEVVEVVRRKPVRTASGVSPVAIMTSPQMCPHGKCLYCPGGPASEFSSSQSYTGHEPAAARGVQNDYDPYGQVTLRLHQMRQIGHPVDKVELILMGGTMTARSHDYPEWFVKRALEALNDYDVGCDPAPAEDQSFAQDPSEYQFRYLEDVVAENETADIRNVGTTFETKPDWCDPEQIDRMLKLGGTKVEVGVQTTYERINREMHRGHGIQASMDANRRLRRDRTVHLLRRHRTRPARRVLPGDIPPYTRLQRVQRDIPADFIDAGVWKSNLRQLAEERAAEKGVEIRDVRAREVGMNDADPDPDDVELDVLRYDACGGTERFISFEDTERDLLVGFCRLRFPNDPVRRELEDAAVVRELHVYGSEAGIGGTAADDQWQHRGYGKRLLRRAEELAADAGYEKLAVISGIGVRRYYREKLGYHQDGPYVSKRL